TDRDISEQLDALFAHRVYFATASARDARAAVKLMMPEFSDTVRPGIAHLSALGHPDVRLHLPKHHAIASWSTPEGRQAPFIGQTIPLRVDPERIALHAANQLRRGARPLVELRQPHWQRSEDAPAPNGATPADTDDTPAPGGAKHTPPSPPLPAVPADSYGELVELDRAHSVRWARRASSPAALAPDRLDLQVLELVASLGHVLTTQVHRHLNPGRSPTTTQRRLKRLSDAGLLARFQFHRRDGGGVPMCHVITDAGRELLIAHDLLQAADGAPVSLPPGARRDVHLRQARHEVHVAGWVLAVARASAGGACTPRAGERAVLTPPTRALAQGRATLGPAHLRLPGGRVPHDFLATNGGGERLEVEHFQTLRPDAILTVARGPAGRGGAGELDGSACPLDVLVEFDDRLASGSWVAKLERYDHFLSGWCVHTARYGRRREALPVVVFVCRDRARARDCARRADMTLGACRAYAGEYPFDWHYPGREGVLFASERDAHEGLLCAQGTPRLPPEVRVSAAHGDPRAGEATARQTSLLETRWAGEAWGDPAQAVHPDR
ncbi:MAG TPA: replication-relaxation family protein, partial [Solirubrobacteraceae bacterium]|nr:replication-relaxation family protein [Solirubrobacteraceae bacterium]